MYRLVAPTRMIPTTMTEILNNILPVASAQVFLFKIQTAVVAQGDSSMIL
jgi:hypothetical protein